MRRGRTAKLAAALALAAVAVTGCDGGGSTTAAADAASSAAPRPGRPVDGIEPCREAGVAGSNLPTLTLPCLAGGPDTSLPALLDGRPAVVNFWASWCKPCVRELPLLQELHASEPDVQVLGVLTADATDNWRDLLARTGATFPSLRDDRRRLGAAIKLIGPLPVTLFVRPDGTLAWAHYGQIKSRAQLAELLDEHLGVRL